LKLQIKINGKTYFAEVEVVEEESEEPALPAYVPYQAPPQIIAPRAEARTRVEDDGLINVCRSPVAGLVIRVNVEAGQSVEANQQVMVLEAMKMETYVTASAAGNVKRVLVEVGEPVKMGQALVEFE
jgi:methylmalonyl-CoA carboxyltransferase small subunit